MEMATERWFEAVTHGRVLLAEEATAAVPAERTWWIGFHGYGENADASLAALDALPSASGDTRVAIDALHSFYTKHGDVVGCWMTKRGREQAIRDNVRYTSRVLAGLGADLGGLPDRLIVVGFSQGTAMTYRAATAWASEHPALPVAVIALGGDVPPELDSAALGRLGRVLIGRGDGETWYSEEKLAEDHARLVAAGVSTTVARYAGGHEWTDEFRGAVERWHSARAAVS